MYNLKKVVKCASGLHNKQATYFIQKANDFRSSIWIEADERKINAKSLLGVLSMAIVTGSEVTISAEGISMTIMISSTPFPEGISIFL